MTENKDLTLRKQGELEARTRDAEFANRPAVDIFENAEGITLQLDMPGVSRDRLNVQADKNSLTVEGNAQLETPTGMEAVYADVRATLYRRSFALSSELDAEKIDASLQDGVLTLRIPKRAELKPRRIAVRTG